MAKGPKESRFAAKLREFGFELMGEEAVEYMKHRTNRRLAQMGKSYETLNRKERRIFEKSSKQKDYIVFGGGNASVHVNDETGQRWMRRGVFDCSKLRRLGFKDVTLEAMITKVLLPPLPPEKTH